MCLDNLVQCVCENFRIQQNSSWVASYTSRKSLNKWIMSQVCDLVLKVYTNLVGEGVRL